MKTFALWIAMAVTLALATVVLGWWGVPIISALWMLLLPRRGGTMLAALSGASAWGLLLLTAKRSGPVGQVDAVLSATLQLPPNSGLALTLVYGALLAGAAALLAQSIRPPTAWSRSRSG